ncbi:MAG: LTA synthase family protein [Clostridiales bacterium]|nr:LTA synthase family protein [Clostridiales bacterium]
MNTLKQKIQLICQKLNPCFNKIAQLRAKLPKKKPHSGRYYKTIAFFNKYSLVFHFVLACLITFVVEVISRRDVLSTFSFLHNHTLAYLYNAFIVFASLSIVYLFRCRAQLRVLISGIWLFLGTVNGLILSNRVTPFSYTDLKCLSDLLAMQNTTYFTAEEATLVVSVIVAFFVFLGIFFVKGPKYQGKRHTVLVPLSIASLLLIGLPITTQAAQNSNVLASYFSNIAQGYSDYGFVYGFSTSVVGRGMSKPEGYSEETVNAIETLVASSKKETSVSADNQPNIICVLLESFIDPYEVNFLNMSEDPIPNFHSLESNYSTGYLTVPVVGAGTANTEFEILTGMSMQYFGTGEYPYKTILKQTDCESIASDLSQIGYGTHVVHNNTATFYSRNNAFSMMGFDTFTSKELMNITEYTPNGNWPTDDVLVGETMKALNSTDGSDFVYTITVEGHGDYPSEKVLENPDILVSGAADEASNNQWEYYVNMIHEVDDFIGDLVDAADRRGEDTIIVMFGDHLPTMGLTNEDMKSGDIFKTKYITWNNMGLSKEDADLTAYQLLAHITDQAGIHEGTVFNYHQTQSSSETYLSGLENLQYDLLYGKRYAYNGEDLYPASDLQMDVEDIRISTVRKNTLTNSLTVYGSNFSKNTKIFVNGSKVSTEFVTSSLLRTNLDSIKDGDVITVNTLGSKGILLRAGLEEVTYEDPDVVHETEETEPTENTESSETSAILMPNN